MSLFSSVMRMASVAMGGSDAAVFPFTLGSEMTAAFPSPHWRVFTASHASSSEAHTVFSFDKTRHDSASLSLARNALQKLKTLRHPSILRYVDSSDTSTHLLIATEACTPFQHDFVRGDRQREYAMALGLYSVTKAISWLNNDCKLVHGALCPASIFILRSGEYRLFGLDIAYKHADSTASVSAASLTPSQRCAVLPPVYRTPEHSKASSSAFFSTIEQDPMSPTPVHYLDSWSLGVLIFDLHSNGSLSSPAQLANKDIIPATLQTEYKRLLSTNPVGRINPSVVLQSAFFTGNELVRTVNFLGELAIQSSGDKDAFFTSFAKQVQEYPELVNKYRILPQLIDALSFGSGMSCFPSILTSVLKIGSSLSPTEYAAVILPAVTRLFSSNERMVRVHLLSNVEQYGPHLTADVINDSIFRHLLTGFHDSQPILREVTMKSMPQFVPKLTAEHLQQALLMLSKMQTDPEPAIRTNTTYCFLESDARVLTSWGLLFLDQIEALQREGHTVLFGCYDVQSKALLYRKGSLVFPEQPPTDLVEFTSPGEGARWAEGSGDYGTAGEADDNPSSRHVSLRVTPEHDMFVQSGSRDVRGNVAWSSMTERRDPVSRTRPPPVPQPHRKVRAQDLLSDDPREYVRMLACAQAGYAPQAATQRRAVQADLHLDDTQFAAFIQLLGLWLGVGSLDYNPAIDGSARGYVTFNQVKQTELTWLRSAFKKAGLREDEHWLTGSSVRPQTTVYITKPAWFAFFDAEFGGKSVKQLPDWTLQELAAAEMRLLISGLHRADGSFAGAMKMIYTSSARFRDQLMQALLHCGYSACAGLMDRKGAIRRYNFHEQSSDTAIYSVSVVRGLGAEEQVKYRPIQATADAWKVSWAEVRDGRNSPTAAASCWPSMNRQQCVQRVPYDDKRDGRAWCVEVEHADHLLIAQRAHRTPDGTVTKQSRPIVVGNCVAKMAASFSAATREKVLAAAFARALKDPFAPARVAGCVAFAATLDFHTAAVCGRRIMPVLSPLCVDDASEVREAALKAMSALMQKVTIFHQDGGVERVSAAAEGKKGDSAVGSDAAASASALLANVSSWAVSSFASKFYGAGGDIGSSAPQTPSKGIAAHPAFNAPTPSAAAATSPRAAAGDANGAGSSFPSVPDSAAAAELNRDGWDDDFTVDDFGAADNDEETAAVVTLSTKKRKDAQPAAASRAQSRRAHSGKKKEETKAPAAVDDDDDDDGFNDAPFTSAAAPAASSSSLDNWDSFQGALSSTAGRRGDGDSGADSSSSGLSAFDPFSSVSPPPAAAPSLSAARKKPPLIAGPPAASAASASGAVKKAGVGKPVVAAMPVKGGKKEDDWASFLNG